MRFSILFLLLLSVSVARAQLTSAQQKALNAYVDYANQSGKEVTLVVESLKKYYEDLKQDRSWNTQHYYCPVQPDDYYFETALKQTAVSALPGTELKSLRISASHIDRHCKLLDTYYKLEDYKKDNHAQGDSLVRLFPKFLKQYEKDREALRKQLTNLYSKMVANSSHPYIKAETAMRKQLNAERKVIENLVLNFEENVHSGWARDTVYNSIPASILSADAMKAQSVSLKYPASSAWKSFIESQQPFIQQKQRAVDEYNFEAKKSDKHTNLVYLNLINYYNGTLVANFNNFIQFSERDSYYGMKAFLFVPRFVIRTNTKSTEIIFPERKDVPTEPLKVQKTERIIDNRTFESLSAYTSFIDDTWWQIRYLQMVLTSFGNSASYYKNIDDYSKRAPMHFDYDEFYLPYTKLQYALLRSKNLPGQVAEPLNQKASGLFTILLEMDAHMASIDRKVNTRQYEKDKLAEVYNHMEKLKALMEIWDSKKEALYSDVVNVFDSHKAQPETSWMKSGTLLRQLMNLNHQALFQAKRYYEGDSTVVFPTDVIDTLARHVISTEYENLKGIEKLGRNNGNCPYTPYEDIAKTSRAFNEKIRSIKTLKTSGGRHPYETLLSFYNDLVDDYNDFCELSKGGYLLKIIHQPEFFNVKYPEEKRPAMVASGQVRPNDQPIATVATKKDKVSVIRDTVYIEKHDTVFVHTGADLSRSMDGYAPNNLVLLLDVSGSMAAPEKLPLLKQSVIDLLSMMRKQDEVSIVIFSGKAKVLLKPTSFKQQEKIVQAINSLSSEGKTDADAGLQLAYKVADGNYIRGGNNRIVLATDGEFPIKEKTTTLIIEFATKDIFLTIFDFGKKSGKNSGLRNLAAAGKGNYESVSGENIEVTLIKEVKSKRSR